jgi:DNA repair protein RecN (Recombination protein N)
MLQELSIKNFAIIDDLRIQFSNGFSLLSGETGSGKSIIINAVNLLLGSRASTKLIRTDADQAELEALFAVQPESVTAERMKAKDIDPAEDLMIRRIISRTDRHRVYINGRLSTMQVLKDITRNMASISGQHAHQGLLKEDRQLLIIDQFGGLLPLREKLFSCYHRILPLINELTALEAMQKRQGEHLDLLQFQQKEIQNAGITLGEDQQLEQEAQKLKHAEQLYEGVYNSLETLYDAPGAVVERLMEVSKSIDQIASIDSTLNQQTKALNDVTYNIEAVVEDLRVYLKQIQPDEKRLETIEARLDTLRKLMRKYGGSLEAVQKRESDIEHELQDVENISDTISETKKALQDLQKQAAQWSEELSQKRRRTATRLSREVEAELASLKMARTKFKVNFDPIPADSGTSTFLRLENRQITETGFDRIIFVIAPNVGETLKPMSDIASGGELSRIVLALKVILAGTESVSTVVFDEVDAGIGGEVAEVVGKKLQKLADVHQVICITHLPQIAKFARHHFRISKHVRAGRTKTAIEQLGKEERIREIARMLSGEKITPKTLAHAEELIAGAPLSDA